MLDYIKDWRIWTIAAIMLIILRFPVFAGEITPDVIPMNEPAYSEHKKGLVIFRHKAHFSERIKSNDCGVCHHDEDGKPIAEVQEGDSIQRCIECHPKVDKIPKGTSKIDKLQWHKEAMHGQCKGCHKSFNKINKVKTAPTTCAKCHLKISKSAFMVHEATIEKRR